jgi:hypothetical protein
MQIDIMSLLITTMHRRFPAVLAKGVVKHTCRILSIWCTVTACHAAATVVEERRTALILGVINGFLGRCVPESPPFGAPASGSDAWYDVECIPFCLLTMSVLMRDSRALDCIFDSNAVHTVIAAIKRVLRLATDIEDVTASFRSFCWIVDMFAKRERWPGRDVIVTEGLPVFAAAHAALATPAGYLAAERLRDVANLAASGFLHLVAGRYTGSRRSFDEAVAYLQRYLPGQGTIRHGNPITFTWVMPHP